MSGDRTEYHSHVERSQGVIIGDGTSVKSLVVPPRVRRRSILSAAVCTLLALWASQYPTPTDLVVALTGITSFFLMIGIFGLIWHKVVPDTLRNLSFKVAGVAFLATVVVQQFSSTRLLVSVLGLLALLTLVPFLIDRFSG